MKNIFLVGIAILIAQGINAQGKYFTRDGHIDFFSSTPVEDIRANNNKVTCVLDTETGNIEFSVLMKAFEFKKALMEEHFNENYVESEQFPKALFKGKIINIKKVDFSKKGVYPVAVEGKLTIHGITHDIKLNGNIEITDDGLKTKSEFIVSPEDYGIEIPGIVKEKISSELVITVDALLKPFPR